MKKNAGFSLMEALILLVISALLILASFPVLTKKSMFQGKNNSVIQCIQKESAATLTSPACAASISGSLSNRGNYLDTLFMFVDDESTRDNGLKVLKAVCDAGGQPACNKIIDLCAQDNKCDLAAGNDISFYLKLLPNSSNSSMLYMKDTIAGYYNIGLSNIKAIVDNTCCNPDLNLACAIKGVTTCSAAPWQLDLDKNAFDIGKDIAIDDNGNAYILMTTGNTSDKDIAIVKINPNGNKVWDVSLKHSGVDTASKITLGVDGYIYAVGTAYNDSNNDMALVKVSPNGGVEWAKTYGTVTTVSGTNHADNDYGMGLTTDANYVYITGYTRVSDRSGFNDLRLFKINSSDGSVVSFKPVREDPNSWHGDQTDNKGKAIAIDGNNLYFVADHKFSSCSSDSHITIGKTSTSFSDPLPVNVLSGGVSDLYATDMVIYGDYIYISAYNDRSVGDTFGVLVVYKISTDTLSKIYRYDLDGGNIAFNGIAISRNGSQLYLIGTAHDSDIALVNVDPSDGSTNWVRLISKSGKTLEGYGIAVNDLVYVSSYNKTDDKAIGLSIPLTLSSNTSKLIKGDVSFGFSRYYDPLSYYFDTSDSIHKQGATGNLGSDDAAVEFTKGYPALTYN